MSELTQNAEMSRLRSMSSAFSRSAFTDVLEFDDYTHFDGLISECKFSKPTSYSDFLTKIYTRLSKKYRCEYVYKNELIKLLLREYGTRNAVYFSEFRVGRTIADIAVFNGISRAFEIKTEFDTSRRLHEQMASYKQLFDRCYLVIPAELYERYSKIVDNTVGVILMTARGSRLSLCVAREATDNKDFDVRLMMSCLRTSEYKNMAQALHFSLDGVSGYELYDYCSNMIARADVDEVRRLFVAEMKKRKNNTHLLRTYPMPVRQMMLSLNLSQPKADAMLLKLKSNI